MTLESVSNKEPSEAAVHDLLKIVQRGLEISTSVRIINAFCHACQDGFDIFGCDVRIRTLRSESIGILRIGRTLGVGTNAVQCVLGPT